MESLTAIAPGRINIIGEHTDYNDGFVLPAAIHLNIKFDIRRNGLPNEVHVEAIDFQEKHAFDLNNFRPLASGWPNYIMGVVHELQALGAKIPGFDVSFTSSVPVGSGLSSSAALECGLATGLNHLFSLGFDRWELIKASQRAEHNFVGMKCGIMDQFSSVMGKKDHVMLLDCRSLEFKYYPLNLVDYEILLLNSNVSHSLADSEYNLRRASCEEGVRILKKNEVDIEALRDLDIDHFEKLKDLLPEDVARKCRHVVYENERVLQAAEALTEHNLDRLGELMYASHHSLQYDYEVSCQEIDFLVDLTRSLDAVLGSRMMGGGFGGCTINLIHKSNRKEIIEFISAKYKGQFDLDLTPYIVQVEDGAHVV